MNREFEVRNEREINGTPEQVFAAITTGTAGWLWPIACEPRLGGAVDIAPGAKITAWEPGRHFANRVESGDWFNELDNVIEPRPGGKSFVRYTHRGSFPEEDWQNLYDGCLHHTEMYQATMATYVEHFAGRAAEYLTADAPASSATDPAAFDRLVRELGLSEAAVGDRVAVDVPGVGHIEGEVDYRSPYFLGIRTENAIYRFFGRNTWGDPVAVSAHHFGGVDTAGETKSWEAWLAGVYA
ncbi:SRPBCC domain-containing protein [Amycolatopsis sp. 195334CR]|uniref:SRPBCC family protein n=1 Tax=Amycolatopsis sp. 195334CR TaxID=2814588 RepID=UPI001A9011B7|nr:SRPBCC domain-containing protein [Amycolatopsis sp. 195334CR]MBN6033802.1 SRPBCC domain-containing protein [Amycolatopsis sp. 195334CR]